jgi:galactokinase
MMDQLASSCGGTLAIDFTRRSTPELHRLNVSLEDHGYRLLMVDTGGSHADLTPEYAAIPEEMQAAAAVLGAARGRDTTVAQLLANLDEVRRQAGDRATLRLIHFLTEDRRVEDQTTALEEGRFADFLQLVRSSGESSMALLQNCASSIDSREQGVLLGLALARQLYPESVCRVHGGGFAGTIQCYVPAARMESFVLDMESIFGPGNCWPVRTGRPGACALGGDGWMFRQGGSR